jgi:hypothetical protein
MPMPPMPMRGMSDKAGRRLSKKVYMLF